MSRTRPELGPVKAWIEPDRWAFVRAFPLRMALFVVVTVASVSLAFAVHPLFWTLCFIAMFRHAAAEASLRELWREGMLHPARVVARGFMATLVRLESEGGVQDAVVVSRLPRRWRKKTPPWGGDRAAVVIAGEPPRLRPLSADFAGADVERARRTTERIPEGQWQALDVALAQLGELREGVHPVELGREPWYGTLREVECEGSFPEHLSDSQAQVWCAGLPLSEEPEMVDRERARVLLLRKKAKQRLILFASLGVLLPAAFFIVLAQRELSGRALSPWLSLPSIAAFVLAPLFLLLAANALRRVRALGKDLAHGKVLRFTGALSSFDSLTLDPDLARLTREGMFAPEPYVEQDMVVLPHARELLYANGRWAKRPVTLHVERIAPPPESPIKLPLPDEVQTQPVPSISVARRRLTQLELDELNRHIARLRKPGRLFWVLAGFAGVSLLLWHSQAWAMPPRPFSIPLALMAWVFAMMNMFRRTRLAARLADDAELGWVLTVDHERGPHHVEVELPALGVETLLNARLDWTVNRRPAPWRRFGTGVE